MKDSTADELRSDWPNGRVPARLEAAQAHMIEGRPDRAIAIWQQMIRAGGKEGDLGHLEYAKHLLESGQQKEAHAELVELLLGRRLSSVPSRLTAALLEDHDSLEEALSWYSAAADSLSAAERADPGRSTWAEDVMIGRRRLRWAMGIPLDDDDLQAQMCTAEAEDKIAALGDLVSRPQMVDGTLQFWPRSELKVLSHADAAITSDAVNVYYQFAEQLLRKQGGDRPILLPRRFRSMSLVDQAAFGARTMAELPSLTSRCDTGEAIEWPPGRNQGCWCGSGVKYKKCCGWPPD